MKNSRQFGIPIVDVSISLCQTPDHDRKREQTLVNVLTLFFKITSCTSSADTLASSQVIQLSLPQATSVQAMKETGPINLNFEIPNFNLSG